MSMQVHSHSETACPAHLHLQPLTPPPSSPPLPLSPLPSAAGSPEAKLRATDVLLSSLAHDPLPLRQFFTSEKPGGAGGSGSGLMGLLVRGLVAGSNDGLPEQISGGGCGFWGGG